MSDNKPIDDKDVNDLNKSVDDQVLKDDQDDELEFDKDHNPSSWEEEAEDEVKDDEDEDDEDDEDYEDDEVIDHEDEDGDDDLIDDKGSANITHIALFVAGIAVVIGGGFYAYNQGTLGFIFPSEKTPKSVSTVEQSPPPLKVGALMPVPINDSNIPELAPNIATVASPVSTTVLNLSASQPVLDIAKAPVSEMGFAVAERDRSKIEEKADTAFSLARESAEKIASLEKQIKSIESLLKSVNNQGKSVKIKFSSVEKVANLNASRYKSLDLKLKKLRIEMEKESEVSINTAVANELSQVSKEINGVLDSVSKVDDRVNSLEGRRREFTEVDSSDILFKMNGKERAIGFNVINATPDENMSVLLTPTRNVIIVFLGEKVIVDGKVRKVTAIEDGGFKVYFEGGYFVDEHRMEDFPAEIKKKKADVKLAKKKKADAKMAKNKQSQKKVEKKVQEIAKVMVKQSVIKMPSIPAMPAMPEEEPIVRQVQRGLSVVMVIEGNRFVLKTRDGLYIRAKEGHLISGYEELGKVGVYITNKKDDMKGTLLIGKKSFLISK